MGDDIVAPVVIKRVSPDLSKLGEVRVAGVPVVELTISDKGDVTDVRFIRVVHPRIDAVIEEAVRQWKFRPATQNGRQVPSHMTLTVNIDWQ